MAKAIIIPGERTKEAARKKEREAQRAASLEQTQEFFEEYEALCRKHGLHIGACGCCDSPWLVKVDEQTLPQYIEHLKRHLPPGSAEHKEWQDEEAE